MWRAVRVPAMLLLAVLAACAHNAGKARPDLPVSTLPVLPPGSLGEARQVSQLLRADYHGRSATLRCVVIVDATQLTVIGLNSLGIRMFSLYYDGATLREERAPQIPDVLQARQLLNDLQLIFWPLQELQQAWQPAGVEVISVAPEIRRLQRAGVVLADVRFAGEPWSTHVHLQNFEQRYTLDIDSSALTQESQ